MRSKRARYIDVDLLRAGVIVLAFVAHFDGNLGDLGVISRLYTYSLGKLFTVGAFFFFVAGYLGQRVYSPRLAADWRKTSGHLVRKGAGILAIYLGYVVFMHLATNTPLPSASGNVAYDALRSLFTHRFHTVVLLYFGFLYCVSPVILGVSSALGLKSAPACSLALLGAVLLLLGVLEVRADAWAVPREVQAVLFDRIHNPYTLLSALATYLFGFTIASWEACTARAVRRVIGAQTPRRGDGRGVKEHASKSSAASLAPGHRLLAILSALALLSLVLLRSVPSDRPLFAGSAVGLVCVESVTPFLAILMMRYIVSFGMISDASRSPWLACLATKTLTFYVLSNLLLGLIAVPPNGPYSIRVTMFFCLALLAYLFTYWHFNSMCYTEARPGRACGQTTDAKPAGGGQGVLTSAPLR